MKISINRSLGHSLYMQMECDSTPHGAEEIMFENMDYHAEAPLDGSDSPKCRDNGSQMKVFQGMLTLLLSTTDALCQLCIRAYGHSKPVGTREHLLTSHFSTNTLADLGHN